MKELGKRALVIGAGRSGAAAAAALRARGIEVTIVDAKDRVALGARANELDALGVELIDETGAADAVRSADFAVVSPGVPAWSPAFAAATAAGLPVIGEIELAYRVARGPIAAITGTKGKSTTAALAGGMLAEAGIAAAVAGNIGTPLVAAADTAPDGAWLIAEVSSFQLETIAQFRPRVAALLNIAEDHLDRYPDMHAYVAAKRRIFENQCADDVIIANADDATVRAMTDGARARRRWFGTSPDCDAQIAGGAVRLRDQMRWSHQRAPQLRGAHNLGNAAAAALIALSAGAPLDAIERALHSFEPLHHRLETVAEAAGVLWVDDSKASTPLAAIAALQAFDQPLVVIAGGRSKGADFGQFAAALALRAKHVVLVGESAAAIDALLARSSLPRTRADTFEQAVEAARSAAAPGDVVLLAPGCSSFDMFESAEQRGARFAQLARAGGGAVVL